MIRIQKLVHNDDVGQNNCNMNIGVIPNTFHQNLNVLTVVKICLKMANLDNII